jgi:hypothetical protein
MLLLPHHVRALGPPRSATANLSPTPPMTRTSRPGTSYLTTTARVCSPTAPPTPPSRRARLAAARARRASTLHFTWWGARTARGLATTASGVMSRQHQRGYTGRTSPGGMRQTCPLSFLRCVRSGGEGAGVCARIGLLGAACAGGALACVAGALRSGSG